MFRNIGMPELLIILAVLLLIFGGSKLPNLARSLGASAKELRKGLEEGAEEEQDEEIEDSSETSESSGDGKHLSPDFNGEASPQGREP